MLRLGELKTEDNDEMIWIAWQRQNCGAKGKRYF
jgi:hypothetical protein